jgi:DNA-binding transcriptional ArsR family regulator
MTGSATLDLKLKALADPQRRHLLDLLAEADQGVADLAAESGLAPATVSHHLRVLREAALIGMRREGRHHDFFLLAGGSAEVLQWLNLLRQRRSQPAWNQEAYREQVLRRYLENPARGLPTHPRRRQVVLEWFHSLLERDRLLSLEELEALWSPHCPDWTQVMEALLALGRLQRQERYILVSD